MPLTADQIKSRRRDRYSRILGSNILPRVFLILMCAVFLLPLYWMIVTSLKSNQELIAYPPTLWPQDFKWSNYPDAINAFTDEVAGVTFWTYAKNTVIITGLSVLGAVISNPIIGYGFARIDWPGRDFVFGIVLATIFVPGAAIMVAMFDIWVRAGELLNMQFINSFWPLTAGAFVGNATWIFLMRQFYMQIPREMSDAARIDGANEFQIFRQIIMPQAKPAIGAIGIFAAVGAWNDFMGPLIYLQDKAKYTLAIGLSFFSSASSRDVNFAQLMAASTIVVIPVVLVFLFFQRYFTEGMAVTSGVKG